MSFKTHNDIHIKTSGTSFVGYITATFDALCTTFGEPTEGDGYKTDAEWTIKFADDTIAIIHNWKNGQNYCGFDGNDMKYIHKWHVNAFNKIAINHIHDALK